MSQVFFCPGNSFRKESSGKLEKDTEDKIFGGNKKY